MQKVIIFILFVALLFTWSMDHVNASPGAYREQEPSCPSCPGGQHCEQTLNDNSCRKAPCESTPRCVKTTGITCANVRCARARCYMTSCEKNSECKSKPKCVPIE